VIYEERGQGYRDVKKVGKHWVRVLQTENCVLLSCLFW